MASSTAQAVTGYRGEVVYFTEDPAISTEALRHHTDGVLYVQDGRIVASGDFNALSSHYPTAEIVDYRGHVITPGFVDTHVHYPQTEMIGAYGEQLLKWLNTYTFPTEMKFADKAHAEKIAKRFLSLLIENGTTTALVFATVHPVSVDAFFEQAQRLNMRMISGKVLMDRNTPEGLRDTPESAYTDSKALLEKWHNKGRLSYAVTPRFAPTSSEEELNVAKRLIDEYPGIYMHTHLAENHQEVAWVQSLFPQSRSYLDVYDQHGLVNDRAIFAHSIHINDTDRSVLHDRNSAVAFCPSSNLFLGSGLFNLDEARKHKLKVGLGTDVGAGTSFSPLMTMGDAYKVTQLRKAYTDNPDSVSSLNALENLYLATLGGARALSLEDKIGSFKPGIEADFVVLDLQSTPVLKQRTEHSTTLDDKLFALETLGDDRAIAHTYVMGHKQK